jgi:predicted  nucleic acid-binding Zn-ribbon protein
LIEGKNSELNEKLKSMETSLSKNVEEKISSLSSFSEKISSLSEELSKLKEENYNFGKRIEQISNIENEIKSLNERIKLLEGQIIQRVASEISDLRMETSGEIKEIKDKISGITATKSEIDIKFLSSRLNSLKENVDYLLNRKVEFDMKLDDFQKALTKLAEKVEDIESMSFATTTVEERIRALEEKMEKMPDEIFNNLKNAISQLPSVRQQKFKAETEKPDLDSDIKKLLEKLSFLESKIMSLEEDVKSSGSGKALIVE